MTEQLPLQDYGELVRTHRAAGADITIATHSVGLGQAQLRGLSRVAKNGEDLNQSSHLGCLQRAWSMAASSHWKPCLRHPAGQRNPANHAALLC